MTRSELIARLAAHSHFAQLTAKDAELSVKAILGALSDALVRGGPIEIRGFGSYALNYRPARNGRNPRTGVKYPRIIPRLKRNRYCISAVALQ